MRKKRDILLVIILLFLSPLFGLSQQDKLKESYNAYLSEKSDSLRIRKHLDYFILLYNERHPKAPQELELLKKELEKFPIPFVNATVGKYEGLFQYNKGEYINSIISYERSLKILPQNSKEDIAQAGNIYISLGLSYSMVNDWENAQINYQNAIGKLEQVQDSSLISLTYLNMSYIFVDTRDWRNAGISLNKGEMYLNEKSDKRYATMIYATLARSYSKMKDFQQARRYLMFSDSTTRTGGNNVSKTFHYLAEGEYYFYRNEFEQAISANVKGLEFARGWGDSAFVAMILENMGAVYMGLKDYPKALRFLEQSKLIAEKNNYLPQKTSSLKQMFQLFRKTGQYDNAAAVAEDLFNLSDSLALTMNNNRRIIMDAAFDSDKKEKRISVLEAERELQLLKIQQKNTLNYILIGSAATLLIIALLTYRNYKQKQKIQQQRITELETEKKLTATEAVLKGEEQERARLAKDLHDGLGGMLSGIKYSFQTMKGNLIMTPDNAQAFERSMDMLDSSIKEMRRVAHSMMPEALVKFGLDTALKDFCNDINKTGALRVNYQSIGMEQAVIEQITSITIYRVVQELINNTMKHASAKTAIVQVNKMDNKIHITVEDDGKGFNPAILEENKGIGWNNIHSRIDYLKGKLDIQSEIGKGTSVHIELNT